MRRFLMFAALAGAAAAAFPVVASGSHSSGHGPWLDRVEGTGRSAVFGDLHVNAQGTRNGPRGSFFAREEGFPAVHGDVTCVEVFDDHDAFVGGVLRAASPPVPFLIFIHDGGEPGHAGDAHWAKFATPEEVANCRPNMELAPAKIERGNYIVHSGG